MSGDAVSCLGRVTGLGAGAAGQRALGGAAQEASYHEAFSLSFLFSRIV